MTGTITSVIPRNTPTTGGNATSASRVASQLAAFGWTTTIIQEGAPLPPADLILAWNAVRVGERLIQNGVDPRSLVVVWTGTDLWENVEQDPGVLTRLDAVACHIVFTDEARERLLQRAPDWADRIRVITPGVEEEMFRPGRGIEVKPPMVLVAGGIRAVKRTHWAIELMDRVRSRGLALDLWLVGPMREAAETEEVTKRAATRPWVRLWGEVPRSAMPSLYCQATVVLNTSTSEGVSNALMEAMACGAAVVATRIPGNTALIEERRTGWLFDDVDEFEAVLRQVVSRRSWRLAVGQAARRQMAMEHGAFLEAARYAHVFGQQVIQPRMELWKH
ncbi:MAG: glycosyltransferase [Thermaerobacter sp.]|nr:glycosyltransferase [Thermaerobacter sp.]